VFPLIRPFVLTPVQGAQTSVFLASAPDLDGVTGGYWAKSTPSTSSAAAQDDVAAARLWDVSTVLVGCGESGS